uniref:FLAP-like endonuclease XPG n=1 Tax=Mimivirus LCMiAC01 TaxID=2506608 RepID=A0A481YYW1_9VIRU|nr:MAG: FLAP-like endonuclease XPG [Mimivirus LCMiAC01]
MGIKGLLKLLKNEAPGCITEKHISAYNEKVIVIDALNIIIRHVMAILSGGENNYSHVMAIWYKTISFLNNGNSPYYVFDGASPNIKKNTLIERRKNKLKAKKRLNKLNSSPDIDKNEIERIKLVKKSYSLKKQDILDIKKILTLLGLPYIQAPCEADTVCAMLNICNVAYGVVTEDMDILPFGAPIMLRDFSNKKIIKEINLQEAEKELELTHSQFIDVCILLGTDYCPSIKGMFKSDQIYKIYKNCGSMENFIIYLQNLNNNNSSHYKISPNFLKKWKITKTYYMNSAMSTKMIPKKFVWNKPDRVGLKNLLCDKFHFDVYETKKQIANIMKIYNRYKKTGKISSKYNKHNKYNKYKYNIERFKRKNLFNGNNKIVQYKSYYPKYRRKNNHSKYCKFKLITNASIRKCNIPMHTNINRKPHVT